MLGIGNLAKKVFGTPNDRKVKSVRPLVAQVNHAMEAADASIAQLQRSAEKLAQAPSTDEVRAALDRLSEAVR